MDLDEMLRVDGYRDMDELINIEPDPDCSPDAGTGLLSPISYKRWYAEFYYVGKYPYVLAAWFLERAVVLKWFYSLRRRITFVGGSLHALYRVLFYFYSNNYFLCCSQYLRDRRADLHQTGGNIKAKLLVSELLRGGREVQKGHFRFGASFTKF